MNKAMSYSLSSAWARREHEELCIIVRDVSLAASVLEAEQTKRTEDSLLSINKT